MKRWWVFAGGACDSTPERLSASKWPRDLTVCGCVLLCSGRSGSRRRTSCGSWRAKSLRAVAERRGRAPRAPRLPVRLAQPARWKTGCAARRREEARAHLAQEGQEVSAARRLPSGGVLVVAGRFSGDHRTCFPFDSWAGRGGSGGRGVGARDVGRGRA